MITRVISALVAASLVLGITYFFKTTGAYAICTLAVLGCIFEYCRLTLKLAETPTHIQISFMILSAITYAVTVIRSDLSAFVAALSAIILLSMLVLNIRKAPDLGQAFKIASASLVGLFYVGVFPGLTIALLGFEHGIILFFGLLCIVFAGDTCAYLSGRLLGKNKLLEAVSPKKTIEGSFGGLLGSAIVGFCIVHAFLPELPTAQFVLIAIVSGAFGQVGDLFESLLKRLADVKDSGRIMPGHGGFLDRLDGVLFAAPVFYVLLRFLL